MFFFVFKIENGMEKSTVERALVCDVVDQENTHSPAIVRYRSSMSYKKTSRVKRECTCGNSSESLLTSSVPDLELDAFAVELNGPNFEVYANRGNKGRGEGVVRES